jgi:cell division protein FtsQ
MIPIGGHPGTEQDRRYWRRRVNRHVRKMRRTQVLLRWTGVVLGNLAVAAVLVVSAAGALRHLTSCSDLSLQTITVAGASKTTPDAVRATLRPFLGRNLLDLDLDEAIAAVKTDPWVLRAEAKRILPHGLRVAIVERTPAAVAVLGGAAHVLDEEGFDMGPTGADLEYDLPVVTGLDATSGEDRARGAAVVGRLRRATPSLWPRISEIDLSSPDRVAVVTSDQGPRLLLDPDRVERNLTEYLALADRIEDKVGPVSVVDLRFRHRISVLPVEDPSLPRSQ